MRILPPVPLIAREAQEDFIYRKLKIHFKINTHEICGKPYMDWCFVSVVGNQIVRKGTAVFIFIYGIHHDASVFPDPDEFDPERFVDHFLIFD